MDWDKVAIFGYDFAYPESTIWKSLAAPRGTYREYDDVLTIPGSSPVAKPAPIEIKTVTRTIRPRKHHLLFGKFCPTCGAVLPEMWVQNPKECICCGWRPNNASPMR